MELCKDSSCYLNDSLFPWAPALSCTAHNSHRSRSASPGLVLPHPDFREVEGKSCMAPFAISLLTWETSWVDRTGHLVCFSTTLLSRCLLQQAQSPTFRCCSTVPFRPRALRLWQITAQRGASHFCRQRSKLANSMTELSGDSWFVAAQLLLKSVTGRWGHACTHLPGLTGRQLVWHFGGAQTGSHTSDATGIPRLFLNFNIFNWKLNSH